MTSQPRTCQARQHSDQMICGRCGFVWDVNDPDPPACIPEEPKPKAVLPEYRREEKRRMRAAKALYDETMTYP